MNPRDTAHTDLTLPRMVEPAPLGNALLLTGAANGRWHAVAPDPHAATAGDPAAGQTTGGLSVCGLWVRLARSHGLFDRTRWGRPGVRRQPRSGRSSGGEQASLR